MRLLRDPAFLSETIGAIYACTLRADAWPDVLARLCDTIGGKRAALGVGSLTNEANTIVALHGLVWGPEDAKWVALNPLLSWA